MTGLREEAVRHALQHDARARVLQACIQRPHAVRELTALTGIPSVSCYRHVHDLMEVGLLIIERSAVSVEGRPYDLYRATVESASLVMTGESLRAAWKTHSHMKDRLLRMWSQLEERK